MAKSPTPDSDWKEAEAAYRTGGSAGASAVLHELGHTVTRNTIVQHMVQKGIGAGDAPRTVIPRTPPEEPAHEWPSTPLRAPKRPEKPVSHMIIPDTQCKPGVPLDHLYWAGRYAAEKRPDVIINIGDHGDLESLSSYDKGKRSFEGRRYKADVAAANEGWHLLEEGLKTNGPYCPRKVYTLGNHDGDRITRLLELEPYLMGTIGTDDFDAARLGWEVYPFLEPVEIDGITYAHYFYNPMSGRPYAGSVDNMLRNIGYTFTMGHQQGLRWSRRELGNGTIQIGLVAGSFYQHYEDYKGPQANAHWRGIVMKHEVYDGAYDPMMVSLDYLRAEFG